MKSSGDHRNMVDQNANNNYTSQKGRQKRFSGEGPPYIKLQESGHSQLVVVSVFGTWKETRCLYRCFMKNMHWIIT